MNKYSDESRLLSLYHLPSNSIRISKQVSGEKFIKLTPQALNEAFNNPASFTHTMNIFQFQ
jgi:hypothetical protein